MGTGSQVGGYITSRFTATYPGIHSISLGYHLSLMMPNYCRWHVAVSDYPKLASFSLRRESSPRSNYGVYGEPLSTL